MTATADTARRAVMMAMTALPLGGGAVSTDGSIQRMRPGSTALVAYYSRSGNTRVIAGLIRRALEADLFEIQPARPYPDDYLATVEEARKERDGGRERALASMIPEIARYETVFVGFPIWGETVPPVILAFLSAHDLSGKMLIRFQFPRLRAHSHQRNATGRSAHRRRSPRASANLGFHHSRRRWQMH